MTGGLLADLRSPPGGAAGTEPVGSGDGVNVATWRSLLWLRSIASASLANWALVAVPVAVTAVRNAARLSLTLFTLSRSWATVSLSAWTSSLGDGAAAASGAGANICWMPAVPADPATAPSVAASATLAASSGNRLAANRGPAIAASAGAGPGASALGGSTAARGIAGASVFWTSILGTSILGTSILGTSILGASVFWTSTLGGSILAGSLVAVSVSIGTVACSAGWRSGG